MKKMTLMMVIKLLILESHNNFGTSEDDAQLIFEATDKKAHGDLYEVLGELLKLDLQNPVPLNIFKLGLGESLDEETAARITDVKIENPLDEIKTLRRAIKSTLRLLKLKKTFSYASMIVDKNNGIDDISEDLDKIVMDVERNYPNKKATEQMNSFSFNDKDSIRKVLLSAKEKTNGGSIFKTHLTGINDMCQGGLRAGETVSFVGKQFSFKSGLSLTIFCAAALLNEPAKDHPLEGKPTMQWYSFEDPLSKVIIEVYGFLKMWEDPTLERLEIEDIDIEEATEYVFNTFQKSKFNVEFYELNPSDYTYKDAFQDIEEEISNGKSIRYIGYDYLPMISKNGCDKTGATGSDTRELLRRFRNFMKAKEILFTTPWQLSSAGNNLLREGLSEMDLVKRVANKGFTADTAQANQEWDLEINVNIVIDNGRSLLTCQRGKHKLGSVIDDISKMYFIVELPKNGNKLYPDIPSSFNENLERRCYPSYEALLETGMNDEIF